MNADPSVESKLRETEIRSSLRSPDLYGADRLRVLRPAPRPAGGDPARAAFQVLYFAFIVLPLAAGIDKFYFVLVDWSRYLAPVFPNSAGLLPREFLYGVGALEILVGIGVAVKPRIFGYVASLWLAAIVVNLLFLEGYYDIALRDFGLALAAFALGKLGAARERGLA